MTSTDPCFHVVPDIFYPEKLRFKIIFDGYWCRRRDSEELRLKWSKKLLDECAQSRRQQIEEKLGQESFILAMEKASLEEQRQQQQMEVSKIKVYTHVCLLCIFLFSKQQIAAKVAR